jgi:hypothetical protein
VVALIQVGEFAKEFYQQGSSEFKGGRIEIDNKLCTHNPHDKSGLQGGFVTNHKKLDETFIKQFRKSADEMFTRINSLDKNSETMRDLAFQMAAQIRTATGEYGWVESASLLSKSDELLKKWKKDVEDLSSTK